MSPAPATPGVRPNIAPNQRTPARAITVARPAQTVQTSPSVDHWSMVLFYAMGVGALALVLFFLLALVGVGLYSQFVWTFTQWDLADVRSAVLRPWAHFTLFVVFTAGTLVGLWFFSGYAWRHLKSRRISNAATRAANAALRARR